VDFGTALQKIKNGNRVARSGWNGKGMFIELAGPYLVEASNSRLFIHMKTAQGDYVPWVASQSDFLENDWTVV
jgi:hypothetical protein